METILSIRNIHKHYGRIHAVNGLSAEVKKGQVFGILGPNGSGKTTTLGITLGLIHANHGIFEWFGKAPSNESRKRIGSVIETPNFFPYLSAVNNLKLVATIKDKDFSDIDEVLTVTGLYDRRNDKFRTYSFGMKQRLAVASALLGKPEVMILDEPTNGLDPQGIAQIRDLILSVASLGITIILASHLLDEVQKICSHVAVLNKGSMLFSGEVKEVLAISDCLEIAAPEMEKVKQLLPELPDYKSFTVADGMILIYFHKDVAPEVVNRFFHEKGITLSHLTEKKRTLEQHFLELLKEDNQ